jgi:hypothetical protein
LLQSTAAVCLLLLVSIPPVREVVMVRVNNDITALRTPPLLADRSIHRFVPQRVVSGFSTHRAAVLLLSLAIALRRSRDALDFLSLAEDLVDVVLAQTSVNELLRQHVVRT